MNHLKKAPSSDSVGLGWGLNFFVSHSFLHSAHSADLQTLLKKKDLINLSLVCPPALCQAPDPYSVRESPCKYSGALPESQGIYHLQTGHILYHSDFQWTFRPPKSKDPAQLISKAFYCKLNHIQFKWEPTNASKTDWPDTVTFLSFL